MHVYSIGKTPYFAGACVFKPQKYHQDQKAQFQPIFVCSIVFGVQ